MSGKYVSITAALAALFFSAVVLSTAAAATPDKTKGPAKAPARPVRSGGATPTDQVRDSVSSILAILKNPALKTEARKNDRRDQLRRAIYARFDFAEMARRSLGSEWRNLNPKQQEEFTRLFTDLLERAYLEQIESYTNEKIVYLKETIDKDYAEVQSKILTGKGEEYELDYRLRQAGREWKVYDVVVENISLVNNYRSQFSRVIANQSYDELLRRMRDKQFASATVEKKP
jgi:phospholipid transport system substrate-binding protein